MQADMAVTVISLVSAIAGLLAAIIGRKQVIEVRHVVQSSTNGRQDTRSIPWYDKTFWLTLWTVLFWPIGIYGILRSNRIIQLAGKSQ